MTDYFATWIARTILLFLGWIILVSLIPNFSPVDASLSCIVAAIFLLVIDLFQYAYRTYGDKKQ